MRPYRTPAGSRGEDITRWVLCALLLAALCWAAVNS